MGNIVLIGFMGCGKSSVAGCLKQQYGMQVIEMDQEITKREGRSIPRIFEEEGEEYFRSRETELLIELQNSDNTVISCGGGVPLRQENVQEMKKNGVVILLTATPQTIYERVKHNHNRPLLEGHMNVPYIARLMEQRREKYEAAADAMIATDGRPLKDICREIMNIVKKA